MAWCWKATATDSQRFGQSLGGAEIRHRLAQHTWQSDKQLETQKERNRATVKHRKESETSMMNNQKRVFKTRQRKFQYQKLNRGGMLMQIQSRK